MSRKILDEAMVIWKKLIKPVFGEIQDCAGTGLSILTWSIFMYCYLVFLTENSSSQLIWCYGFIPYQKRRFRGTLTNGILCRINLLYAQSRESLCDNEQSSELQPWSKQIQTPVMLLYSLSDSWERYEPFYSFYRSSTRMALVLNYPQRLICH